VIHTTNVYLIDDHALLRGAMRSILEARDDMHVVGDTGDARRAVAELPELRPDVVLLDIAMPGLSGIDAIPMIREAVGDTKILMLTHHEGETFVEEALSRGAAGYLSKDSDPDELPHAIRTVRDGTPYVSPKVSRGLSRNQGRHRPRTTLLGSLTPRERQVFQLLAIGKCNKEVAQELDVSVATAKKHRENLQRKLRCHSTPELTRLAVHEGLLEA
jgi:DNA-binding NarL/FixJ family response regulator